MLHKTKKYDVQKWIGRHAETQDITDGLLLRQSVTYVCMLCRYPPVFRRLVQMAAPCLELFRTEY
jgi:hypothetical protein